MKHGTILSLLICAVAATVGGAEPPKEITVDLGSGEKLEMVLIPAGSFMMGTARGERDEYPVHKVNITKPFYLAKYELTQQQWAVVMGGKAPGRFQNPKHPVESLVRLHVAEFLKKLNEKLGGRPFIGRHPLDLKGSPRTLGTYRLPTEAQWEYACRAGSNAKYSFGDDERQLVQYAWFYENSEGTTHPVGEKKPNRWGLYDMHGNVWEMCRDEYFSDYYTISTTDDPPGPPATHRRVGVVRGGGWNYSAKGCRSSDRGYFIMNKGSDNLGFRVSRSVEPK